MPQHPSPERHKVSWLSLLIGLVGAPTAWAGQILLSMILSSYACYPHHEPIAAPLWIWLRMALTVIGLASFTIGILCALTAFNAWRRTRNEVANEHGRHVMNTGEGRTRFLALCGILNSILFMVTILFTAFALILVGPCKPWF